MTRNLRLIAGVLIFIYIAIFGTSCRPYRVRAQTEFSLPSGKTKIIPLKAALYVKPEYRNFKIPFISGAFSTHDMDYVLGDSFRIGTKKVSDILFREVAVVKTMNAETELQGIDVIVVPDIIGGKFLSNKIDTSFVARIAVKWTILDTNRKELYVNSFAGEATGKMILMRSIFKLMGRAMDTAVLEAFNEAVEGISAVEWWKDIKK